MTGGGVPGELHDFDPYDPHWNEPTVWEAYARARAAGEPVRSSARGGFWMLGGYEAVRDALRAPLACSSAHGHRLPPNGTGRSVPVDYDPPEHTGYRRLMAPPLSPARAREMRPFLRRLAGDLIGRFRERGGGDFVTAVATPLPLEVLTEVVGFSPATVARFRELAERMWAGLAEPDGGADVDIEAARGRIAELMRAELDARREDRRDDYVTHLLDARIDGRALSEDERVRVLTTFAVAGHETTVNAASTLALLLATEPGLQRALRADPSAAPRYVEELLRLHSPAQNFARRTTCPVRFGDTTVPAGAALLLSFAAANRDPRWFPDPDRFDPERDTRSHLAFGWGLHHCLGAPLARAELAVLLQTLCDHPPVELDGEVRWSGLRGGTHLGPTRLPLRFAGDG